MPQLRVSPDDHVIQVNGINVGHFTRGRVRTDPGNASQIETAEGPVGVNVKPGARGRPGSGSFSIRSTSPDLKRLAELSAAGESVTIAMIVVKNFGAFSYKRVGLTEASLGPVDAGPDSEVPEIEVTFSGTGYFIE